MTADHDLAWLGTDRRPPELQAAFQEAAREVTARLCLILALLMGLVTALYWPTDPWLLPDDPDNVAALARVRMSTLTMAAVVALGLRGSAWIRAHAIGWTATWTLLGVIAASWTLAHAAHGRHPWEQAGYLVPLTSCALFMRLGPRLLWTAALGLAWSAPFLHVAWHGPRAAWATSPLFQTFSVVVGVAIGHVMYALFRENWYTARELAQRGAAIEANDEARRNLFATLSHEVRTPLTLVSASLRRLSEGPGPTAPGVEIGQRGARQIEWLLDQILELARLEARPEHRLERAVDVTALVREAVTGFAEAYAGERTFDLQLPPTTLLVLADAIALSHLLHNLLGNAVKHTEPGGRIRVQLAVEPTAWSLQVEDDGHGVAPADRERIFERFARSDAGRAALRRGTGIGLALVREAVRVHGGEIVLIDGDLGGACFRATIPLRPTTGAEGRSTAELTSRELLQLSRAFDHAPAATTTPEGPVDLLIVEDDPDLRAWMASWLSTSLRVATAEDGAEALRIAHASPPHAMIADLEMPGTDGWALAAALRAAESLREVPLLVLSAQVDPATRVRALQAGASDFLRKPFDPDELRVKVTQAVARGREARRRRASTDEDRQRLARELHDNLGQSLASASLLLAASTRTADLTLARERLELVGELLSTASDGLREALAELSPERRLREGLPDLLGRLVAPVAASGWQVALEVRAPSPAEAAHHLAVYRVAQQAVANAVQHGASPLSVRWVPDGDGLLLEVCNALRTTDSSPPPGGSGLLYLRERAQAVGGRLQVVVEPTRWVLRLHLLER